MRHIKQLKLVRVIVPQVAWFLSLFWLLEICETQVSFAQAHHEQMLHSTALSSHSMPWMQPLSLSSRFMSTQRLESYARSIESKESERQKDLLPIEILDDFDRYVLASALDPDYPSNPLYHSWMSLSHTWGRGSSGYLLNARQMKKSPYWLNRRYKNYGTAEMIAVIKAGTESLRQAFPDAPKVIIGDLSKRYGGHFPPHLSHQSGRDADIGYFIKGSYAYKIKGLTMVNRRTMDVAKTWAFLSGMLRTGLVESAFVDYQLQKQLYHYAKAEGKWSEKELNAVFSYPLWKGKTISHLKGHSDHMHVRFKAPLSQQAAVTYMRTHGKSRFRPRRVRTRPKSQENLARLAKRFRVSQKTLMRWNGLNKSQARRTLNQNKKYIVGYYTPYFARHIKFPLLNKEDQLAEVLSQRK